MAKRRPMAERRRQIAAAAGELFAERGVQATTVRDIGESVGLLSGSLYHYFKTKHEIVHELMRSYGADMLERYEAELRRGGTAEEQLERLVVVTIRGLLEHANETTILLQEQGRLFQGEEFAYVDEYMAQVAAVFIKVMVQGSSTGEFRADVDPAFAYGMLMSVMGAVHRWYDPQVHSVEQVAKGWLDLYLNGIRAQART
ncbi:MAG: TetR/AcrR family transcriptional regulator [Proteobacteria bacterium]|nr:TetR/AcrR family transcriptional regulator [Pseudomonadota bacterium]